MKSSKVMWMSSWVVGANHRKSRGYRNFCTRTSFSRLRLGTDSKSGRKNKKHNFSLASKCRDCDVCWRTKRNVLLQKANWWSSTTRKKFGNSIKADHELMNEGCESRDSHRYAVVVQNVVTQCVQLCQWQKFLEPTKKQNVICTDNSLEFANSFEFAYSFEDRSFNHWKTQCLRNVQDVLADGKLFMKGDSENYARSHDSIRSIGSVSSNLHTWPNEISSIRNV